MESPKFLENSEVVKSRIFDGESGEGFDMIQVQKTKDDTSVEYVITNAYVDGKVTGVVDQMSFRVDNSMIDKVHSFLCQQMEMTNSHKVKQFTEESKDMKCPEYPQKMTKSQVGFLIKMIGDELIEFAHTVCDTPKESAEFVKSLINVEIDKKYKKAETDVEIIAEQADAEVDILYYLLNACAKQGVNADKVFDVVHQANMNKKWKDGKFHRREDGKVLKPADFKEADVVSEIERQLKNGAWA